MPVSAKRSLGIFCWYGFRAPLGACFQCIKAAGFDAVSLWWAERTFREMDKAEVAPLARANGLRIDNAHVSGRDCNRLWSDDPTLRTQALDEYVEWLEDCGRFGIPAMVMHITEGDQVAQPNAHGLDSFARLVNRAEAVDVKLAIENVRQPSFVAHLLDAFASPNLGFCYDSSHDRLYSDEPTSLLHQYGDRLVATHFSDTDGLEDVHWLPGTGVVDWPAVARAFPAAYSGPVALEVGTTGQVSAPTAEEFLAQAYDKAQWLQQLFTHH
ncbi:MAG: TIM barrel protein [Candidatus Latescibacteria bacterium]|nr:TIM barrel protein [Candidatus Latescibacterota bacterium]